MMREVFLQDLSLWTCLWQSTVFLTLGLAVGWLLRRRPSRAYAVLLLAMMTAALVPFLSAAVRHYHLGLWTVKQPPLRHGPLGELGVGLPDAMDAPAVTSSRSTLPPEFINSGPVAVLAARDGVTWGVVLLYAWIAATIALLTRLAVTFFCGAHLVRRAHRQACAPMQKIADTVAARLGVLQGLQVRASDQMQSPVVWCWAHPSILLVPSGCQDGQTDWAGVLAHELAHCKRGDHLTGLLAELAASVLPWNPLMWLSKRQLIRLGEEACDDWVVAAGHSSEDYAESLLRFRPQRRMAFVPAVVHSRTGVAARVRRILSDACGNPRMGTKWALAATVLVACVAVGFAFAQTRPVEPIATTAGQADPALQNANGPAADTENIERARFAAQTGREDQRAQPVGAAKPGPAFQTTSDAESKPVAQPIELRYSVFFSSVNRQFAPTVLWAKAIEMRTNGRVKITIFDNGSLTPPERCYEGVVKGTSDLGVAYFAQTPERFPLLQGLDLPLGYPSGVVATRVAMELMEKYKPAEVADTHLLYVHTSGPGLLASKKPVRTLEDVKGMRIRTAALQGKIASALGGTPVDVPWNATYDALRWDVADAALCPMETLLRLRQGEVISAITETPAIAYTSTLFVTMNLKKWQSLPPEIQQVFTDVSREWAPKHGQAWDQADAAGRAFVKGLNREIISLSPEEQQRWKQAARPVLDAYVQATKDKGLPGEQFLKDAQDLIAKYAGSAVGNRDDRVSEDFAVTKSLHQAVLDGDIERVRALLAAGAKVNEKGKNGQTALHVAVKYGYKDVVELLVAKEADVNAKDQYETAPLHTAAAAGDKEIVQLLLDKGADVNILQGSTRWTPLHGACQFGHAEVAELLLQKGAKVNATAQDAKVKDITPLYCAVAYEHNQTTRVLVANDADVTLPAQGDRLPFYYVLLGNDKDLVELFISKGSRAPALHLAAFRGDMANVQSLCAAGTNVDARDEAQWTPLYWAVAGGQRAIAEFLLNQGADVSAKATFDETPLHIAAYAAAGSKELVELLLARGADVNAAASRGGSPLHYNAIRRGHVPIMAVLLAQGANLEAKNQEGKTPLYRSLEGGHKDASQLLIAKGADIKARENYNRTPLHAACRIGPKDVVGLLLAKGADIEARDDFNWTPLLNACVVGQMDVVELLLAKGADINAKLRNGATPLSLAEDSGHKQIVDLLRGHGARESTAPRAIVKSRFR